MAAAKRRRGASRHRSGFDLACSAAGLESHYRAGLGALENAHAACIEPHDTRCLTGSIDTDGALEPEDPTGSRWDYGVGLRVGETEVAIWIEPHTASSTSEARAVIRKLKWLRERLKAWASLSALTERARAEGMIPYRWLATSDTIRITADSREAVELARAGVSMPTRRVTLP